MNTESSITVLRWRRQVLALLLLGGAAVVSAPIIADANVTTKDGFIHQSEEEKQALGDKWGIELVALRSTAEGHMVDFRYRVVDAEKAVPLFKRQTKPYLIHQESGKALGVPNTAKLGSLRNSNMPQIGRTYWMFFGNHNRIVRKGDLVTVAIGDFRAKDLTVQ
jgi:hypothetical protein